MKLLEVDEAANHIRELVDPEANIIWGSAFNPDLDGKIRVSVVATGIEQSAEHAHSASSQPLGYGLSRTPKKPVLPLPTEEELAEDAVAAAPGQPARFEDEEDFETSDAEAYAPPALPETYDPGEPEGDEEGESLAEPADDGQFGAVGEDGYASLGAMRIDRDPDAAAGEDWDDEGESAESGDEAFELTLEAAQEPDAPPPAEQDELLLDASRLVDADEPVQPGTAGRRKRMLGGLGGEEEAEAAGAQRGGSLAGSTLFERMANLSRANSGAEEEDEEEEEGSAGSLRIPRFLGRQNNQ
jgi:cell division protein FtsZ